MVEEELEEVEGGGFGVEGEVEAEAVGGGEGRVGGEEGGEEEGAVGFEG